MERIVYRQRGGLSQEAEPCQSETQREHDENSKDERGQESDDSRTLGDVSQTN